MDSLASQQFVEGFAIGKQDQRGFVQRDEGGTQERALAAQFRRWARRRVHYPVANKVLERIASSYEHEAAIWDVEETLDRRLNR